jgi:hypothetical protein
MHAALAALDEPAPADLKSHAIMEGPIGIDGWTFEKEGRRVALRQSSHRANNWRIARWFAFRPIDRWVLWSYVRCFLLYA